MTIVLAYRTADVRHDAELSGLIQRVEQGSQAETKTIEVQGLVESDMSAVAGRHPAFAALGPKGRQCLRNCQLLKMWCELAASGLGADFAGIDELMERHWAWTVSKARNSISEEDLVSVVQSIATVTLSSGRPFVSRKDFASRPKALAFLISSHILKPQGVKNEQLRFSHQLMLDYWQGQVLPDDVQELWEWLNQHDQDLSVRPALRRTLERLSRCQDEKSLVVFESLLAIAPAVLGKVRWHIKHLVLSQLATVDSPTVRLVSVICKFITATGNPVSIMERVLQPGPAWCVPMTDQVCTWLVSESDPVRNAAIALVRSLMPAHRTLVDEILRRVEATNGHAALSLLELMPFDCSSDSSRLFVARLKWLAHTSANPLNDAGHWIGYRMQTNNPLRAQLLLRTALSRVLDEETIRADEVSVERSGMLGEDGIWAECGKKFQEDGVGAYSLLFPLLEEAVLKWRTNCGRRMRASRRKQRGYPDDGEYQQPRTEGIPKELLLVIENLLRLPFRNLGTKDTEAAKHAIAVLCGFRGRELGQIAVRLLRALSEGAPDLVAIAIAPALARGWVWNAEFEELRKGRLVQLVLTIARGASVEALRVLEDALLTHYPNRERKLFGRYHELAMQGQYNQRGWGESQHDLLEAISAGLEGRGIQMSPAAQERLFQWRRTFSNQKRDRNGMGGSITSPIRRDRLGSVSDLRWLDIMSKTFKPNHRWKQLDKDHVGEASHSHFATDLANIAAKKPRRVVGILRQAKGREVPSEYLSNALWAVATCERDVVDLPPAEELEAVFQMCTPLTNWDEARGIAICVSRHAELAWSDATLNMLMDIAKKGPVENGVIADGRDIANDAVNNPRPLAVEALVKISALGARAIEEVDNLIEETLASPDSQQAWQGLCGVARMWTRRRDHAIKLYVAWANAAEAEALCWQPAISLLRAVLSTKPSDAMPVIDRMFMSHDDVIAESGAFWLAAAGIAYNQAVDLSMLASSGRLAVRVGVAKAVNQLVRQKQYRVPSWKLIAVLLNDSDKKVRDEVRHALMERKGKDPIGWPEAPSMLFTLFSSKAFLEDVSYVLEQLDDYKHSLIPFAEAILNASASLHRATSDRKPLSWAASKSSAQLASILIRLYQESASSPDQRALKIRCLDAWDVLLENSVPGTLEQLRLADN